MKKFLTFVLVLAMVMSVSSFAMAAEIPAAGGELASGTYSLTGDIVLTSPIVIPAGNTVTIDLAGHKLSYTDSSSAAAALITNNGNLTITDSSENQKGTISFATTTPSASNSYSTSTIFNNGVLLIEKGNLENTGNGGACYVIDCYEKSTTTINGGNLRAEKTAVRAYTWRNEYKVTVNVNGGSIYSAGGYGLQVTTAGGTDVELNISGGKISTDRTDYPLAVYINCKDDASKTKVNVTGGEINNQFYMNAVTSNTMSEGNISISGGVFADAVSCGATPNYPFISGGSFATAPDSSLIADDSYTATITANNSDVSTVVGATEDKLKENLKEAVEELIDDGADAEDIRVMVDAPDSSTNVAFKTGDLPGGVFVDGDVTVNGVQPSGGLPMPTPELPQVTNKPSSGSGISVKYNGGNSFSTSNPSVPTGVEIDGVPVTFNGTGSNFSVGCISSDAKWVTVKWNSTSVTTNFTPDGLVECTTVSIPKTGDMSFWAAIAQFLGF